MNKKTFELLPLAEAEVYYCKDFFPEPVVLYKKLDKEISWENFPVKVIGKTFPSPRDNAYFADSNKPYMYSGFDREPKVWTHTLSKIRKKLNKVIKQIYSEHLPLNAVLCNRYNNGDQYIGFHSDDEKDLDSNSFIVSVSLGAVRDFVFKHKRSGETLTVPLESGSVVLMGKGTQKNYKHSVPKRKRVKESRINLTFRSIVTRE